MVIMFVILLFVNEPEALVQSKIDAFIFECFEGDPPNSEFFIIEETQKQRISRFLISQQMGIVFTYWKVGNESVWILNREGQERLITLGVQIKDSRVVKVEVIQYREERGWEIKTKHFLDQYINYSFHPDRGETARIDGISGATLSVDAVKDAVIIALQLDALLMEGN